MDPEAKVQSICSCLISIRGLDLDMVTFLLISLIDSCIKMQSMGSLVTGNTINS